MSKDNRRKKTPKASRTETRPDFPARMIYPTRAFQKDLKRCSDEVLKSIKSTLRETTIDDLFSRRKLRILRVYKGFKIWYFEGGPDIRITAFFASENKLYLLSIEDHDSLNRAHDRIISTLRQLQ